LRTAVSSGPDDRIHNPGATDRHTRSRVRTHADRRPRVLTSFPACFVALALVTTCAATVAHSQLPSRLLPIPSHASHSAGDLPLSDEWAITNSCQDPRAAEAVGRLLSRVARLTQRSARRAATGTPLTIACDRSDTSSHDEQYLLEVSRTGANLRASTPHGVLHGLVTLLQLIRPSPGGFALQLVRIDDRPAYAWRSLMIDVARHFISIETLKKQVDAMELAKLNVLHLHLSDNEAFRLRSDALPRLGRGNADGQAYSPGELTALVAYAAVRGIRVIPEIDVPGHSRALLSAYPQFSSAPREASARAPGRDAIDPTNPAVYPFLDTLFTEVAAIFPDRHIHVGGDEVSATAWTANPRIVAQMASQRIATPCALQAQFTNRVHALLTRRGRVMIGWDELLDCASPPRDVIIQSWRSSARTAHAVSSGYSTIVSTGYYLDWLRPAASSYAVDPADPNAFGLDATAWRRVIAASLQQAIGEPFRLRSLPPLSQDARARLLGGAAAMWTETVSDEMLGDRVWPRAAAIAERLWTTAAQLDSVSLASRLRAFDALLAALDLGGAAGRTQLLRRLAPTREAVAAVATLIAVVEPVKNYGRLQARRGGKAIDLTTLADAASPTSVEAEQFAEQLSIAQRSAWRDTAAIARLRERLERWRANHDAFVRVSRGLPRLEAGLPASALLRDLAAVGSLALDALVTRMPVPAARRASAQRTVQSATRDFASSRDFAAGLREPQPPAYLLVSVTPSIAKLLDLALAQRALR
jgi:hexosaminidase